MKYVGFKKGFGIISDGEQEMTKGLVVGSIVPECAAWF